MRLCDRCITMGFVFLCPDDCDGSCGHDFEDCPDGCDMGCDHGTTVCPDCKGYGFLFDKKGALICLN
jgi:hypothetical protein